MVSKPIQVYVEALDHQGMADNFAPTVSEGTINNDELYTSEQVHLASLTAQLSSASSLLILPVGKPQPSAAL